MSNLKPGLNNNEMYWVNAVGMRLTEALFTERDQIPSIDGIIHHVRNGGDMRPWLDTDPARVKQGVIDKIKRLYEGTLPENIAVLPAASSSTGLPYHPKQHIVLTPEQQQRLDSASRESLMAGIKSRFNQEQFPNITWEEVEAAITANPNTLRKIGMNKLTMRFDMEVTQVDDCLHEITLGVVWDEEKQGDRVIETLMYEIEIPRVKL